MQDPQPTPSSESREKANELRELTGIRTAIKGRLTRFANKALQCKGDAGVKEYLARIDPLLGEFESVQAKIDLASGRQDEAQLVEFEDKFFEVVTTLKERLSIAAGQAAPLPVTPYAVPYVEDDLPKIRLPQFAGSYQDWPPFRDLYNSLVHNKQAPVIKKYHHLRSCLTGEAARLIEAIPLSEDNYEVAWEALRERYDKPRFVIEGHVKTFVKMQPLNKASIRSCLNDIQKSVRALRALNHEPNAQDTLLIQTLLSKTDRVLREEWQAVSIDMQQPTLNAFTNFLERKCSILEAVQAENREERVMPNVKPTQRKLTLLQTRHECAICKQGHPIYYCGQFINLPVNNRIETARNLRLCLNCLRAGHPTRDCKAFGCRKCKKSHNSLLHLDAGLPREASQSSIPTMQTENVGADQTCLNAAVLETDLNVNPSIRAGTDGASSAGPNPERFQDNLGANIISQAGPSGIRPSCLYGTVNSVALLSTAVVELRTPEDTWVKARAVLDTGSQINIMTDALAARLNLTARDTHMSVFGLNDDSNLVRKYVTTKIRSPQASFEEELHFITLPKITNESPTHELDRQSFLIPKNIRPTFHRPGVVEVLLGVETFYELLCVGQIRTGNGQILQKTRLGWIVAGYQHTGRASPTEGTCILATTGVSLNELIPQFWELENVVNKRALNREDKYCEHNFESTVQRAENGRLIVTLPFREKPTLGDSEAMALKRFRSLEKQLAKNESLKKQYHHFMEEYLALGHMKEVATLDEPSEPTYYLPHHGVINETSTTTKLRVVFDGSARSSNGKSLNDFLLAGPKLQNDLLHTLLRFRLHRYVLTADVAKMFRQVLLHADAKPLHRILWRSKPEDKITIYELQTVTYGTTCASYLAVRAIQHLPRKHILDLPYGARALLDDLYVDDMLSGARTIEELRRIRDEAVTILSYGGFELHKWASNCQELVPTAQASDAAIELHSEVTHKTLGIQWYPTKDMFRYSIPTYKHDARITKRAIMSYICSIFDPLGCISPVVITAKLIIQELWKLQLDWDESLPTELHSRWLVYRDGLKSLSSLRVPRNVLGGQGAAEVDLHGFCDASEVAYGACIYVTARTHNNVITANLLCAKSRVAPLKTQSIPRLELCGAHLLAELMSSVMGHITVKVANQYYWSDSTIVIQWIRAQSRNYQTFVANRIGQIQTLTVPEQWRHTPTRDNPADLISRGTIPGELVQCEQWWHGPSWLREEEAAWPVQAVLSAAVLPEQKSAKSTYCLIGATATLPIFDKFSRLDKLVRVAAYCFRFLTTRVGRRFHTQFVAAEEYALTLTKLIAIAQGRRFGKEINSLRQGSPVPRDSHLLSLTPFLDENRILRVGGRIRNADIPFEQRHQVILPSDHNLTALIVRHVHEKMLHAGIQTTLYEVRNLYWPLRAKALVRSTLRCCVKCKRHAPKFTAQLLGDLPQARLQPSRPFLTCGVDYCGPFLMKPTLRSRVMTKAYLALFVCFVTKAIHVEVVSDLTSECFLNALKRFAARRGKAKHIYSDNATTFVGANRELREILTFARDHEKEIKSSLCQEGTQWHFIPARSPHFGGLWEAGIKSLKFHLKRSSGNMHYAYEELQTLAVRIEAVLNSRPLTPMSNDPTDLSALTPGHFLIGAPLTAIGEYDLQDVAGNRLSRWQRLQQQIQHVWKLWHKSYLNGLQQRNKWKKNASADFRVGDLVVIKEDNLPVQRWPLGRILETHPGKDGVTRVVTLKTRGSTSTRAVSNLCKLISE